MLETLFLCQTICNAHVSICFKRIFAPSPSEKKKEELYSVKPKATCHVTRQSKHQCNARASVWYPI